MNMKGGVGKSTVAMHIAGALAIHGVFKRVLLIDYDPHFNLCLALIPAETYFDLEKKRKTSLAILQDSGLDLNPFEVQVAGGLVPPKLATLVYNVFRHNSEQWLDLVPSTLDLMYVAL